MATSKKSASSRLTDIWTQWSMGSSFSSSADAKTQKSALEALVAGLADENPIISLRSMQALLVDPERPSASNRLLFNPLWELVRTHWDLAGTGNSTDTMRLQALLLAAWGERFEHYKDDLIPTLVSPWGVMVGRDRQRPTLLAWIEDSMRDEQDTLSASTMTVGRRATLAALVKASNSRIYVGDATDQATVLQVDGQHFIVTSAVFAQRTQKYVTELATLTHQLLVGLDEEIDALRRIYSSQELMWWGQALYCSSQRCSFRRIADPDEVTWWAAAEAAQLAITLPIEPSASYLQEVLRTAGVDVDERRSVTEHAHALRRVLKRHTACVTVPQELAGLVREDPFGLPVSLICVDHDTDDARLNDSLGVEPDRPLDRGEWAAWVFRELMLQRRWPAPEPT